MMGHKEVIKNSLENDVIFGRGMYCYLVNNSKLKRFVKKCISKRNRSKAKHEIKQFDKQMENFFDEEYNQIMREIKDLQNKVANIEENK